MTTIDLEGQAPVNPTSPADIAEFLASNVAAGDGAAPVAVFHADAGTAARFAAASIRPGLEPVSLSRALMMAGVIRDLNLAPAAERPVFVVIDLNIASKEDIARLLPHLERNRESWVFALPHNFNLLPLQVVSRCISVSPDLPMPVPTPKCSVV
jgi:hypothetical protein